jgi:hypothetical protein
MRQRVADACGKLLVDGGTSAQRKACKRKRCNRRDMVDTDWHRRNVEPLVFKKDGFRAG